MTYLDGEPEKNNYNVYTDYIDSPHYYSPGISMAQTHGMIPQPDGAIYYSNGGPLAPLATLEPVQEVTTPEENSSGLQHDGFSVRSNSQGFGGTFQPPGVSSPSLYTNVVVTSAGNIQIPRIHSDGSTHV